MIHIFFTSSTQNHMFANTIPLLIRLYIVRIFPYDAIHAKQQQKPTFVGFLPSKTVFQQKSVKAAPISTSS